MSNPKINLAVKQFLALSLSIGLNLPSLSAFSMYDPPSDDSILIRGGISLNIKKGKDKISSLSLRDTDLKDLLYTLAKMGEFNIIVDDEVDGKITVDLKDVSIDKAFEYITTLTDLTFVKDGNTLIVAKQETGETKALNRLVLKSLPVRYSNAQEISDALNNTVFSITRPGGNKKAAASADSRTNSVMIMGNESDIDLAQRAIAELDFPLQHKTILLKNAPAKDVATAITQILFGVSLSTEGSSSDTSSSSSGNSTSTNSTGNSNTSNGSSNNSNTSNNSTGTSSSGSSSSSSGSSGGSGGDDSTVSAGSGVEVFKGGPMTFIINKANNTLTLMGTSEQIQQAEALMYDLDIRPPQVAIQVSVVQVTRDKSKTYDFGLGASSGLIATALQKKLGISFSGSGTLLSWNPGGNNTASNSSVNLNNFFQETNTKVLANPTVVALSGTSSTINLTRQIVQGVTTTSVSNGITTSQPNIAQVGITLNITPKVSNNGTVSLTLAPTVSSPSKSPTVVGGNPVTLITSSTLNIGSARIQDGETLILGGLIQENHSDGIGNKIPFLGDIPIIGSLFRNSNESLQSRTELIVLVTPHIIKEEGVPYFREEWKQRSSYEPVSLYNAPSKLPNTYLMAAPEKNTPNNTNPIVIPFTTPANTVEAPKPYGISTPSNK